MPGEFTRSPGICGLHHTSTPLRRNDTIIPRAEVRVYTKPQTDFRSIWGFAVRGVGDPSLSIIHDAIHLGLHRLRIPSLGGEPRDPLLAHAVFPGDHCTRHSL